MAEINALLIIKGKKTLSQVPKLIRPQVEEILLDMGVDLEQVKLVVKGGLHLLLFYVM